MQWWKLNHVLINLFIFGTNLFFDMESMDTRVQPASTFFTQQCTQESRTVDPLGQALFTKIGTQKTFRSLKFFGLTKSR